MVKQVFWSGLFLFSVSLQANQLRYYSVEEMIRGSEKIVLGTVAGTSVNVNIVVDETLKGTNISTVVLPKIAQRKPMLTHLELPRIPQFRLGERVLLFLSPKNANGLPYPIGWGQGVFRPVGLPVGLHIKNDAGTILNLKKLRTKISLQKGVTP